jgi:hypothetical protein
MAGGVSTAMPHVVALNPEGIPDGRRVRSLGQRGTWYLKTEPLLTLIPPTAANP